MSWCLASAYLLATPLGTYLTSSSSRSFSHSPPSQATISQRSRASLLRYIPKSYSHQIPYIRCFHLAEHVLEERNQKVESVPLMKAIKNCLGVPESLLVFPLSAAGCSASGQNTAVPVEGLLKGVGSQGNVFTAQATRLDTALWKI